MARVRAGISYALTEWTRATATTEELTPLAEKLLEVPQELNRAALDLEVQEGSVVADRCGMTDHSHEITMPARLGAQNAEAVLGVVVSDALDEAGQHFLGR
jgi:hypothetical protein